LVTPLNYIFLVKANALIIGIRHQEAHGGWQVKPRITSPVSFYRLCPVKLLSKNKEMNVMVIIKSRSHPIDSLSYY